MTDVEPTGLTGAGRRTFRSLRTRNFRLFFFGQLVSNTGNWLTNVALRLLVLHLSGSGIAVGALTAAQFGPILVLSAWAGAIADRSDKRKLLFVTQGLEMGSRSRWQSSRSCRIPRSRACTSPRLQATSCSRSTTRFAGHSSPRWSRPRIGPTRSLCTGPICFEAKKLDKAALIAGAELQGTAPMWQWIGDEPATTFSY
jgi:Transmembrane secretion effector